MSSKGDSLVLVPLGGVGEIGKNMWVVGYGDDLVVLDCGGMFPEEDMLGVDLVIPDISYLVENRDRVRAIVLTHGHEDHVGALPYVLQQLDVPVYGTRLTLGLVKGRLDEHGLGKNAELHEVQAGQSLQLGAMTLEFVHVNHSLADVVAIAVHTPAGTIVYATDFKFDHTPIDGRVTDLQRLAALGANGVLCLLSDSTNAERPGYTLSEKIVGETFMDAFRRAQGRILVATFASNVHRIQQVMAASARFGRKVCVMGRSMVNNVGIASRLGYLHVPEGLIIDVEQMEDYPPERLAVITTGSQGEPMAALTRMAMAEHRRIEIVPGDTVIISASPIPGNERLIGRTINHLFRQGAEVIYHAVSGVHVSGHASQEELKLMINLIKPRYFIPIHGEYRMLVHHARLAEQAGLSPEHVMIAEIGDMVEISAKSFKKTAKVEAGSVMVDGLGVGDVGTVVLRDRQQLAQDGILVVVVSIDKQTGEILAGPEFVSRGFVYVRESERLFEEAKQRVKVALESCEPVLGEWNVMKNQVRDTLSGFFWERTRRRPMILPVVMET
ncbi:MAG: ribonuclease J [Limnochordia bacterium]